MTASRIVFVKPKSVLTVTHHKNYRMRLLLALMTLAYWLFGAKTDVQKWQVRNRLRPSFIKGEIGYRLAGILNRLDFYTKKLGVRLLVIRSELRMIHHRLDGTDVDYGVVSRQVVTDAGVAFLVDGFDSGTLTPMNFHGVGTTNTAEAANQTGLIAESTTVLTVDSTRATGTKTQPSANVYRSTATVNFDGSASIVEHGLFNDVDVSQGTMWDRSVHASVGVVALEAITYQHDTTFPSGG